MQNGHGASGKGENDTVRIEIRPRLSWTVELSAGVFKAVLTVLQIELISSGWSFVDDLFYRSNSFRELYIKIFPIPFAQALMSFSERDSAR
jgi:hypothetical protein